MTISAQLPLHPQTQIFDSQINVEMLQKEIAAINDRINQQRKYLVDSQAKMLEITRKIKNTSPVSQKDVMSLVGERSELRKLVAITTKQLEEDGAALNVAEIGLKINTDLQEELSQEKKLERWEKLKEFIDKTRRSIEKVLENSDNHVKIHEFRLKLLNMAEQEKVIEIGYCHPELVFIPEAK